MLRGRTQSDAENGKRDDDHKLRIKPNRGVHWYSARGPLRRKRVALCILLLTLVYLFIHNLPEGIKRPSTRPTYTHDASDAAVIGGLDNSLSYPVPGRPSSSKGPPKIDEGEQESSTKSSKEHWFDGPIKFNSLATSLFAISKTGGTRTFNKNVLFAASSLKSAGTLLPMACEMAKWRRNDVHFAFMGREDISMDIIKEINGIPGHCGVWFHDARPDYGPESTNVRMGVSISAALGHINNYMHPQAIIVDTKHEEHFFLDSISAKSSALQRTLICLPPRTDQSMLWLTRLDSASLSAYNTVNINIVVHAQPSAAGSLIRLLQSLSNADYFDSSIPRLSIELPHDIDDDVTSYLADHFKWPPTSDSDSRQFDLHKRVSAGGVSPKHSSVRFLESFWPVNRYLDHVLVLSPRIELSPLFYHYLKYALLEYKYSLEAANTASHHDSLLGIALSTPHTYLNDSAVFIPPKHFQIRADTPGPSFLWHTPSSEAALYFGDKWVNILDFASKSLVSTKEHLKEVATTYPAWLEHIYTFSRTRGYSMLYPQPAGAALAVVHNDLYIPPEEYTLTHSVPEMGVESDDFTADPATHLSLKQDEDAPARGNLLEMLDEQLLTSVQLLPILSADGRGLNVNDVRMEAETFSRFFRREVGECKTAVPADKKLIKLDTSYLFCNDGEDRFALDTVPKAGQGTPGPGQPALNQPAKPASDLRSPKNAAIVDYMATEGSGGGVVGPGGSASTEESVEADDSELAAQDQKPQSKQPAAVVKEPIPGHVKEAERAALANIVEHHIGDSSSPKIDDSTENWVDAQVKQNLANNYKKYGDGA